MIFHQQGSPFGFQVFRHPRIPPWFWRFYIIGFQRFLSTKGPPMGLEDLCHSSVPLCFSQGFFTQKFPLQIGRFFVTKGPYLCLDYFSSPRVPPWVSRFLVTRGFPFGASGSNEAIKSKEEFQECFKGDLIVKFQRDPKNLIHQSKSDLPEVIRMWDYKKTQIYSIVNHYYSLVGLVLPSLFY